MISYLAMKVENPLLQLKVKYYNSNNNCYHNCHHYNNSYNRNNIRLKLLPTCQFKSKSKQKANNLLIIWYNNNKLQMSIRIVLFSSKLLCQRALIKPVYNLHNFHLLNPILIIKLLLHQTPIKKLMLVSFFFIIIFIITINFILLLDIHIYI